MEMRALTTLQRKRVRNVGPLILRMLTIADAWHRHKIVVRTRPKRSSKRIFKVRTQYFLEYNLISIQKSIW
jgi:hypothetical protein